MKINNLCKILPALLVFLAAQAVPAGKLTKALPAWLKAGSIPSLLPSATGC